MWYTNKGYIHIHMKGHRLADKTGQVRLHRLVYEDSNKCCLLGWGDVHHINGVKDDNRPENLQGIMHGSHSSMNRKKDLSARKCLDCGSEYTRIQLQIKKGRKYTGYLWHRFEDGFLCNMCAKRRKIG